MNEKRFKMNAQIVAVEAENCEGCIFKNQNCVELKEAKIIPLCTCLHRKDGKEVSFVIESFKINERKKK